MPSGAVFPHNLKGAEDCRKSCTRSPLATTIDESFVESDAVGGFERPLIAVKEVENRISPTQQTSVKNMAFELKLGTDRPTPIGLFRPCKAR